MNSPAAPTGQRILAGILFMCAAGMLFPVMSGFAKFLGADYNSLQISWARAFGHIVFMLMFFVPRFGVRMLRTRRPGTQLARSALLFASNASSFLALVFIPLAKSASITNMAPLLVLPLAWAMLGERTSVRGLTAVIVGFVGVLIVIQPGSELFHWASVLPLLSAACYALYQVLTRRIAGIESPETSAIYSSVVGGFGMFLVLPFVWKTPHTVRDIFFFCSLGVLGGMGHYFVARALAYAPANIVAPFQYMQLIGSVIVGYLFFGDFPNLWGWIGAAIIVAAGLYTGWLQTRK
ncbi:Permease of the drug/metabolite transporter (DMT) superfamily [Enhydrobacter aerosaccus]|uniref:Permease of the drug/metabolite transporter (DMT) superfamily n=1 Tax=Enhydrobacter aerosaccus TaxID=225324 RepID=A0A1T4TBN5_9HYPH|nr:DMT family transporter [Enhydrobacter aerosaccus]SKA37970.1 Permease of the drug/metabolite transporter (DMT) superfamily [Enhydrobacter aerosaccus]